MRVYVAGALSSKDNAERSPSKIVTDYIQNIHRMCQASAEVVRKGHIPYVPALDFLLGVVIGTWEEGTFRSMGMSFL